MRVPGDEADGRGATGVASATASATSGAASASRAPRRRGFDNRVGGRSPGQARRCELRVRKTASARCARSPGPPATTVPAPRSRGPPSSEHRSRQDLFSLPKISASPRPRLRPCATPARRVHRRGAWQRPASRMRAWRPPCIRADPGFTRSARALPVPRSGTRAAMGVRVRMPGSRAAGVGPAAASQ